MTPSWLGIALLVAACGAPADVASPPVPLPAPFADFKLPTSGATIQRHEGPELVLAQPGDLRAVMGAWVGALDADGWTLSDPESGPGFVRVEATRGTGMLEIFFVKKGENTEIHLEIP